MSKSNLLTSLGILMIPQHDGDSVLSSPCHSGFGKSSRFTPQSNGCTLGYYGVIGGLIVKDIRGLHYIQDTDLKKRYQEIGATLSTSTTSTPAGLLKAFFQENKHRCSKSRIFMTLCLV